MMTKSASKNTTHVNYSLCKTQLGENKVKR